MAADTRHPGDWSLYLAQRQLALLCECVGDSAIGALDCNGIIDDWHEGGAPVTGLPASALQGNRLTDIPGVPVEAISVARTAGRYGGECSLRRADGECFAAVITLEIVERADGEAPCFCVVVHDLTRERQRRKELDDTRAQLFQCQKIEALAQLTSGIAHDFNNLLQAIVGALDVVAMQLERGSTQNVARFLGRATESAHSAAALTRRLLTLARPQPVHHRGVDVNALIRSMAEFLPRTLGEHISLRLNLGSGLKPVHCDAHQLESVLLNLAINARDAMPHGGQLAFVTQDAPPGAGQACRGLLPTSQHCLCLEVSDSGTGMDAETRARALDPFFTTKPAGRGTGLGLSMIRTFVDQVGGAIELDSEPGHGTTVRIRLPCSSDPVESTPLPRSSRPRGATAPEQTILVVEDSAMVRELVASTLRDGHYRVLEAADGPEGLTLLRSGLRIDLVISDVGLPGMKGPAMVEAAMPRPGMKVLFMTGYGSAPRASCDLSVGCSSGAIPGFWRCDPTITPGAPDEPA